MSKLTLALRTVRLIYVVVGMAFGTAIAGCSRSLSRPSPATHLAISFSQDNYVRALTEYEGPSDSGFDVPHTEIFDPQGDVQYTGSRADIDKLLTDAMVKSRSKSRPTDRKLSRLVEAISKHGGARVVLPSDRWTVVTATYEECQSCMNYQKVLQHQQETFKGSANLIEIKVVPGY